MTKIHSIYNNLPKNILIGPGSLDKAEIPSGSVMLIADRGLMSTGIVDHLAKRFSHVEVYSEFQNEPTTDDLDRVLKVARAGNFNIFVGVGGGSVLDVTKAVAALVDCDLCAKDALGSRPELKRGNFFIAFPTTAGTGSEATPNALFIDSEDGVKKAIISSACLPDTAVLDPELTLSLPPSITASTGVDALCHCVESLISVNANPVSEAYSIRGISLIEKNLPIAVKNGIDLLARCNMLAASFLGGAALTIAGTTAVHALAYPLGKRGVPHGVANSMLFLEIMRFNIDVCGECLMQLAEGETEPKQVLDRMEKLVMALPIEFDPGKYSITISESASLAAEAMEQKRLLSNNPKTMTVQQAKEIYEKLWDNCIK